MAKKSKLNKIVFIKDIIENIDVRSICNSIDEIAYTTDLVRERSQCTEDLEGDLPISPYDSFREYIESDVAKPCFIIGCSGVGKSSFLVYQQTFYKYFFIYDLHPKHKETYHVKNVHLFLTSRLIGIVNSLHPKKGFVIFYEVFKRVGTEFRVHLVSEEIELAKKGQPYNIEKVVNAMDQCKKDLYHPSSNLDQVILFNKLLIDELSKMKILNEQEKLIIAIDNIDRRGNPGLESKMVCEIIPFCENYVTCPFCRFPIAIRRLTYERYPNQIGGYLTKRLCPDYVYIKPPDPLKLMVSKILSPELRRHTYKADWLFGGGPNSIRGRQCFFLMIYVVFLLYRKEKHLVPSSLISAMANENAREMIAIILSFVGYDYSDIITFKSETKRLPSIIGMVPKIHAESVTFKRFDDLAQNIFQERARDLPGVQKDYVDFIEKKIASGDKFSQYALTDYHLLSMMMRFGYSEYNPELEGTEEDVKQLIPDEHDIEIVYHEELFPMPFVNVFDARFSKAPYNNVIRYLVMVMIQKNQFSNAVIVDKCKQLQIPSEHTSSVVKLFENKHYLIGNRFEYLELEPKAIVKLTRKGKAMFDVVCWPRYLNIVMPATQFSDGSQLRPSKDTDLDKILQFIGKILDEEEAYFNSLSAPGQECFNSYVRQNKVDNYGSMIGSMFSLGFFRRLLTEVHEMIFKIMESGAQYKYDSMKKQIISQAQRLGYAAHDVRLMPR